MPSSLLLFLVLAGAAEPPDADRALSEYRTYERMTPVPVEIGIALVEECVQPAPVARHGPHRGFVSIFMNESAAAAFRADGSSAYPPGSVIVKRKELEGGEAGGFGGMIKRDAGYDPANGDWEYFTGTPARGYRSGRLAECGDCHLRAQETDYVFGDWSMSISR